MRWTMKAAVGAVLDRPEDLIREVAKDASRDANVLSMQKAAATRVADAARRAVLAHPAATPSQQKEQAEVADAIKVITVNYRWNRRNYYPNTNITVYLAVSPHPAAERWEFGTRKNPATMHMYYGFQSA